MRLLLVVHCFLPKYSRGTEVLTFETARTLRKRGHEVRVLTAEPTLEANPGTRLIQDVYEGIPVERMPFWPKMPNLMRATYDSPDHFRAYVDLLKRFRPDVVHIFHALGISMEIVRAAKHCGTPVVFTATDFWTICPTLKLRTEDGMLCSGPDAAAHNCRRCLVGPPREFQNGPCKASAASTGRGVPGFARPVVHGLNRIHQAMAKLVGHNVRTLITALRQRRQRAYDLRQALPSRLGAMRARLLDCNRIIAPTQMMERVLVNNGVPASRITQLGFGLNVEYMQGYSTKESSHVLRIGFIGSLVEPKGPHVLLEGFLKLKASKPTRPIRLDLWGELYEPGSFAGHVRSLAGQDSDIHLRGTFPNNHIGKVLAEIDLLVVPSLWYENAPLVVYSAFATRTPVLASNLGSLAELVQHDGHGLLFAPGDAADLARQLRRVIDKPDLLEGLRLRIPAVKSMEQSADELEALYQEFAPGLASAV
jgi:glycosyltransferase involved in cell wall biosynthesis